ncbi:unnamed protein product [Rhizopus stolonifer]
MTTDEKRISFVGMNIQQVKKQLTEQEDLLNPISRQSILPQTDMIRKELEELGPFEELSDSLLFKLDTLSKELFKIKQKESPLLPPPTSRRSKFQSKPNPDINFATEIGQGLLIEVRKLQNIIQEKEETIRRLTENEQKDIQRQLKQREEIEERLKEENWNLEVANQDLLSHLTESNQTIARHNTDYLRLTKHIKEQSEQIEIMKAQEEKKSSVIEAMKARHEQEMHQLRRHAANGQRENTQIQQQVDTLLTELKICKAKLTIKQTVQSRTEEGAELEEAKVDDDDNPQPQTVGKKPSRTLIETETLKQSLAHAHRIISNLRSSAHKEKLEKFELKKMLSDSQETIEQLRKEPLQKKKQPKKKQKQQQQQKKKRGISRKPRGVASSSSSSSSSEVSFSEKSSDSEEEEEEERPELLSFGLMGTGFGTPLSSELNKIQDKTPELTMVLLDGYFVEPLVDNSISPEVAHQWVNEALEKSRLETEKTTVPRSLYDQALVDAQTRERALNDQIQERVTKSVVEQLVSEAVNEAISKEKENSVPKEQVEKMMKDRVLISRMNELVAEAVSKEKQQTASTTVSKEEVERLMNERMLKSTVDELVAQAAEGAKAEEKENTMSKMEEMMKNMIHKAKVDEIVAEAIRSNKDQAEPAISVARADVLIGNARNEGVLEGRTQAEAEIAKRKDIIPKAKVDILIAEATSKAIALENEKIALTMLPMSEAEKKADEARLEVQQKMEQETIAKSKVETMMSEAQSEFSKKVRELEQEIEKSKLTSAEAEKRITDTRLEFTQKMEEMVPKVEVEKMMKQTQEELTEKIKQAEQAAESMLTREKHEAAILEAVENTRASMVTREAVDALIAETIVKENEKHQQALSETEITHKSEQDTLRNNIQSYKKESEEINQRMKMMMTKESTDVLVKRAVADALKKNEIKQQETLASMITKVDADIMTKQAVTRALEKERKETEEREATMMISKAEAEALAKVAAADAIVNERQVQAAREKELISKEEADTLSKQAVQDAIEKEKLRHAEILAKERKAMKEKEETAKKNAESMVTEAVRVALEKEKEQQQKETPQEIHSPPPIVPERSISTSRLAPPSIQIIPTPSVSTPSTPSKNRLRLSKSVSSLRRKASSDNISTKKDAPRPSTESHRGFGTLRILENTTYNSRKMTSKTSLKNISKQGSTASFSTIATEDARPTLNMPMDDNMSMFADSEGNTDMDVISSITQTMIGEWMMKHTRRYVGSGISEHKHKRFFWVHPYTKSLYWSSIEPGVDGSESRAKSAFIESVVVVSNHSQQESSPMSLLIRTPKRDIKITAPNLERHDIWHKVKKKNIIIARVYSFVNSQCYSWLEEIIHNKCPQKN